SPLGIEAWLVRAHTLPMIAVEFAFLGSAEQDPADKPGVANMATSLLDEGAGPYDANAFHDRLERKAIEMSFRTGRDYLRGAMRTLKDNRDEAFDYLRLALSEPRFDPAAVERERAQIDRTFGVLPAKAELKPVAPVVPQGLGRRVVINLDVPQAVVYFGGPGIARSDPDFMAAYIVNHILGGGAFSSRLYVEVREKR